MTRHRAPVRPRYGRISVLGSALLVTGVAVLGGAGALPGPSGSSATADSMRPAAGSVRVSAVAPPAPEVAPEPAPAAEDHQTKPAPKREREQRPESSATVQPAPPKAESAWLPAHPSFTLPTPHTALPEDSGEGRRVVFSEERQRVWLVEPRRDGEDRVLRTYLVSGSIYDNLDPGTYEVYSRSEQAYGIDDSGTMKYFVRFTQGDRAAIGFHDIPMADGAPVQTKAQLGTPLSHGCIRQKRADAKALWSFAPLGTTVVVTA